MESRKHVHKKGEKGARDLMICCQTCELPNGWLSMYRCDLVLEIGQEHLKNMH